MIERCEQAAVTLQPGAEAYAANELSRTGLVKGVEAWLEDGVALVNPQGGFPALAAAFREQPPVFIRHICPCALRMAGPEELAAAVETLAPGLERGRSFSLQLRLLGGTAERYVRHELLRALSQPLEAAGYRLDARKPEQVISLTVAPGACYAGLSLAADNLSDWAGGNCHFRQPGMISRAEGKLLEAFDLFQPALPAGGRALDLGAAPGGWTRVLRERGFSVTAVDPALLHPSLAGDPGVTHCRMTAQAFFAQKPAPFDLMVNDMRMDALLSARLMGVSAAHLAPGATAVMTLKLVHAGAQKQVRQVLALLGQWYEIVAVRQLFHNRSEVTAVLRRKA